LINNVALKLVHISLSAAQCAVRKVTSQEMHYPLHSQNIVKSTSYM